jgi:hypothetical protein
MAGIVCFSAVDRKEFLLVKKFVELNSLMEQKLTLAYLGV